MSKPSNDRAGKILRLLKIAFDNIKNIQEPQDKTRTFFLVQDDDIKIT